MLNRPSEITSRNFGDKRFPETFCTFKVVDFFNIPLIKNITDFIYENSAMIRNYNNIISENTIDTGIKYKILNYKRHMYKNFLFAKNGSITDKICFFRNNIDYITELIQSCSRSKTFNTIKPNINYVENINKEIMILEEALYQSNKVFKDTIFNECRLDEQSDGDSVFNFSGLVVPNELQNTILKETIRKDILEKLEEHTTQTLINLQEQFNIF